MIVFALALVSCGADESTTSPTTAGFEASTIGPPTTTAAATTSITSRAPPAPPTPTSWLVPSGWTAINAASLTGQVFPPCCGDTWHGLPSPSWPATGAPLADGDYAVKTVWPDDPAGPLEMELYRLEQCAQLPADACEQQATMFAVDDLGVDVSTSRPVIVALDDQVSVVVVGWATTTGVETGPAPKHGNGADLAQLASAVDRAYAGVFASRLAAGEDPATIVADVIAHPTGGFAASPTSNNAVVFTEDAAPPLLFQVVFPVVDGQPVAGRGTDVLQIVSMEVTDGRVTLYVYAGYYP